MMIHRKEWWEWVLLGTFALLIAALAGTAIWSANREVWRMEVTRILPAPPGTVFYWLTERERRIAWQPGVVDIAPLTGEPHKVGATRLLFMRDDRPRQYTDERTLLHEPPRRLVLAHSDEAEEARVEYLLEPAAEGTRLLWREDVRFKGLERRLLAILRFPDRRTRAEAALGRLAALLSAGEGAPLDGS